MVQDYPNYTAYPKEIAELVMSHYKPPILQFGSEFKMDMLTELNYNIKQYTSNKERPILSLQGYFDDQQYVLGVDYKYKKNQCRTTLNTYYKIVEKG